MIGSQMTVLLLPDKRDRLSELFESSFGCIRRWAVVSDSPRTNPIKPDQIVN